MLSIRFARRRTVRLRAEDGRGAPLLMRRTVSAPSARRRISSMRTWHVNSAFSLPHSAFAPYVILSAAKDLAAKNLVTGAEDKGSSKNDRSNPSWRHVQTLPNYHITRLPNQATTTCSMPLAKTPTRRKTVLVTTDLALGNLHSLAPFCFVPHGREKI